VAGDPEILALEAGFDDIIDGIIILTTRRACARQGDRELDTDPPIMPSEPVR
jgi:hypothetical protein